MSNTIRPKYWTIFFLFDVGLLEFEFGPGVHFFLLLFFYPRRRSILYVDKTKSAASKIASLFSHSKYEKSSIRFYYIRKTNIFQDNRIRFK